MRSHAMRLFSANLDTKSRVYLRQHGVDVTRVNTALAMIGRVHFALVTIATMPPLVHNLLFLIIFEGLNLTEILEEYITCLGAQ